jgi:hypothetical protein
MLKCLRHDPGTRLWAQPVRSFRIGTDDLQQGSSL